MGRSYLKSGGFFFCIGARCSLAFVLWSNLHVMMTIVNFSVSTDYSQTFLYIWFSNFNP